MDLDAVRRLSADLEPTRIDLTMPVEFVPVIAFLAGALLSMLVSRQAVTRGAQLQRKILQRGAAAQGRVLRVWRPPLFGAFTRVYFEFQPDAAHRTVQTCHVDRRRAGELMASLPPVGAVVSVRYLPERPAHAVIAKLVSRFTD